MKNKLKYIIAVFCCFIFFQNTNAQIKLSLKSEKQVINMAEPVVLYVTATNAGNETVKIYEEFSPIMTEYFYLIKGPDGKEQVYTPIYIGEPSKLVSLNRGKSINGVVELFFGAGKYYFAKPGDYEIKVRHQDYYSKPIIITVVEPGTENGLKIAKNILSNQEMGLYYELGGNDELTEANKLINEFSEKDKDLDISSYFLQIKAQNLSRPARNFVSKKPRGPKYEDALKILQQTKQKELPFYYQNRNATLMAKIYTKTNRKTEAIKELEDFKNKLNGNPSLQKFYIKDLNHKIDQAKK